MNADDLIKFCERKCKAKDLFYIKEIDKPTSYEFVRKYHYLGDAKFFCCRAFGLFTYDGDELVGCAVYGLPQGTVALKGWFGLGTDTKNIFELQRLCMLPELNGTNATSFLLGGTLKIFQKENTAKERELRKEFGSDFDRSLLPCRAVITLACSSRHIGSIYQVCNFTYYGTTDQKSDFFRESDGKVNPRGSTKDTRGVWLLRPKKHRYAYIFDKTLKCLYNISDRPMLGDTMSFDCCGGTGIVFDKRFGVKYTCPRCTGKLEVVV